MAKLNHFIANKVGIEMDQASVLVACVCLVVSAFFTSKYLVPLARPMKVEELFEVEDVEEVEDQDQEQDQDEDQDQDQDEDQDDMPLLEGEVTSGEITDDEMPPGMPPLEDDCEWITKEEFDAVTIENTKAVLAKIDEYHNAMAKALDDKYNDILSKSIDDKVDHLRKELNSSIEIDIMDASIQLEEKIMKNIKEWFVPLHAKKELDTKHFQGWKGDAALDATKIQIAIKNTTYNSYEENDAWVDVTSNSEDSVKYRDSLLGLHDNGSWICNTSDDKNNASLSKRYVTLGWNHSVNISVVINNMPLAAGMDGVDIKNKAGDILNKLISSVVWKRVLIPIQTNNA